MTGRLESRVTKLERAAKNDWRVWESAPADHWPDDALIAFLAESEGWPPGRQFTDEELDEELAAITARIEAAHSP